MIAMNATKKSETGSPVKVITIHGMGGVIRVPVLLGPKLEDGSFYSWER